ncbi:TPA: hypothetical protein DCZ31_03525 [Patescibacteria group bacterium]|nr:hypothetical protein [Candidatus Gracilibacteria bacterium]
MALNSFEFTILYSISILSKKYTWTISLGLIHFLKNQTLSTKSAFFQKSYRKQISTIDSG